MAYSALSHLVTVTRRGPTPGQIKLKLDQALRNVGFAAVVALTRTAKDIKEEQPREMERVFDRPTPFTLRSVYMQGATKAEPWARVWLKDSENDMPSLPAAAYSGQSMEQQSKNQKKTGTYRVSKRLRGSSSSNNAAAKYLMPQIRGGPRRPKGVENALRAHGLLRSDEYIVPGKIKLDRYGNVPPGTWTKILSDQGAMLDPISNRPGTRARKRILPDEPAQRSKYFVATIRGVRAIWERQRAKGKIAPILIIVRGAPEYRQRYDFIGVSRRVFKAKWSGQLSRAIAEGFAKAKR
jgi:hypothetical protein